MLPQLAALRYQPVAKAQSDTAMPAPTATGYGAAERQLAAAGGGAAELAEVVTRF